MPDRALIIFPGALGDLICLGPALSALSRRYQGCGLELMARAELAEFAAGRMGIARGHSIDRRETSLLFSPAADAAAEAAEFFGQFRVVHSFFAAADQHFRHGLARACAGRVFFHPFRPEGEGHVAAAYLRTLGESVIEPHEINAHSPSLRLRAVDLREAQRLLAARPVTSGGFVLMMPGSGSPAKNWPVANYVQLAGRISESTAVVVVLGPAESALRKDFAAFDPVQSPTLGGLAALGRMAAAFVGNDSGVSHLAAAAGGRGVVIFGPTDPARWRPLGAVSVLRRMPLPALAWTEVAGALDTLVGRAVSIR